MTTWEGKNHKFTVSGFDYYIKTGTVPESDWFDYPHLMPNDICFLDLTVSKQQEELRVYEVLMEMATMAISKGATIKDVIRVMQFHNFPPNGVTSNEEIPMCKSVCDYIGKYLEKKMEGK